jgi:hypothetical protein
LGTESISGSVFDAGWLSVDSICVRLENGNGDSEPDDAQQQCMPCSCTKLVRLPR